VGGAAATVKVTVISIGELLAVVEAIGTLAPYVPTPSEPSRAVSVSVAGAVVPESTAESQPVPLV
jgi:hypothetical protein